MKHQAEVLTRDAPEPLFQFRPEPESEEKIRPEPELSN